MYTWSANRRHATSVSSLFGQDTAETGVAERIMGHMMNVQINKTQVVQPPGRRLVIATLLGSERNSAYGAIALKHE